MRSQPVPSVENLTSRTKFVHSPNRAGPREMFSRSGLYPFAGSLDPLTLNPHLRPSVHSVIGGPSRAGEVVLWIWKTTSVTRLPRLGSTGFGLRPGSGRTLSEYQYSL